MSVVSELVDLVVRQATEDDTSTEERPLCGGSNQYDGRMGLRIAAVFVVLVGSSLGALFPVIAKQQPGLRIPEWVIMFVKYFGSGVIICTAFIHLLSPANEALSNPCLTGPITEYPWAQGIAMISMFSVFFAELLVTRCATYSTSHLTFNNGDTSGESAKQRDMPNLPIGDPESGSLTSDVLAKENYATQMTSIFILEFGIIFHSVFIGLTLAVSGEEFVTLFIVIVFHQTFEGLGLGARLATVPFPNKWTSYAMALGYGLTTPTAIAIGLGIRSTFEPASERALVVNGIFDSISAGILLYTGLVELMANEFLFGNTLREAKLSYVMCAFGYMVLGAALMALLGKWA